MEAKAALQRADESVKQGRAIMAFTIVTIFFVSPTACYLCVLGLVSLTFFLPSFLSASSRPSLV